MIPLKGQSIHQCTGLWALSSKKIHLTLSDIYFS